MAILVIAEHDHTSIKAATRNAVTAATKIGGEIHLLVAGSACAAAADAAAGLAGVSKVLLADAPHYADQSPENLAALVVANAASHSHLLAAATTWMRALLLVAVLALSACASTQRTLSYNAGMPDADVYVGDQRFQVWFHDRDQTVLVLRGEPRPLGQLMATNLTVYANDRSPGILWWGAAANAVLTQFGCYGTEVTGADQMREIEYTCREPVDVNAQVTQRREEWRRGVRVQPPQAD